jgi:hypothetical protein
LLALFFVTVALLGMSAVVGGMWWGGATCAAVVLLGYVVHLRVEARRGRQVARRRTAVRRAPRPVADERRGWAAAPSYWGDADDAAGGQGETGLAAAGDDECWDPVDVPLPTYVTKPPAPQRVVDVAMPGTWTDSLLGEPAGMDEVDGPAGHDELDDILERRVVGD